MGLQSVVCDWTWDSKQLRSTQTQMLAILSFGAELMISYGREAEISETSVRPWNVGRFRIFRDFVLRRIGNKTAQGDLLI